MDSLLSTPEDSVGKEESEDQQDQNILDFRQTPLNACSIETFSSPVIIQLQQNQQQQEEEEEEEEEGGPDEILAVPLCLGCYELDESTSTRNGRLDLYAIPIVTPPPRGTDANNNNKNNRNHLSFGGTILPPSPLLDVNTASGVLDGEWFQPNLKNKKPSSVNSILPDEFYGYYASAHADGKILIHGVSSSSSSIGINPGNPFQAVLLGESESPSDNDALCLALAWDNKDYSPLSNVDDLKPTAINRPIDTRIVSSYSDGYVAVHRIQPLDGDESVVDDGGTHVPKLKITLEYYWQAHTLFRSHPAEVWCCNFIQRHQFDDETTTSDSPPTPIVVTGGDEGTWKGWDVRTGLTRPIFQQSAIFGAGVTVISPHPRHDHIVAVGSYDETIAIFDVRTVSSSSSSSSSQQPPVLLHHSDPLGGGIWRCKWHPYEDDRLLVGAMHGGCRVLQYTINSSRGSSKPSSSSSSLFDLESDIMNGDDELKLHIQQEFTKHQSMAYGADWIYCHRQPPDNDDDDDDDDDQGRSGNTDQRTQPPSNVVEAAATCSFYDRAMYLWKTM